MRINKNSEVLFIILAAVAVFFLFLCTQSVSADTADASIFDSEDTDGTQQPVAAEDISTKCEYIRVGFSDANKLNNEYEGVPSVGEAGASITLRCDIGIGGVYVIFDSTYGKWQISDGKGNAAVYESEYIHQYADITERFGDSADSVTLTFPEAGARISEIYVLSEGELPDWVQIWEPTLERADILIVSTHSDDEHLFFAGVIPYYCAKGYSVAVAYMTEHYESDCRHHERLNGLWKAGIRNYPVFGGIVDKYSTTLEGAKSNLVYYGNTMQELDAFCVEILRRFRPKVLMTHDFEGEYGHGQHRLLAASLARALELSSDASSFPESADMYGTYDVPKAYFHLYSEGQIVFDWDTPMQELDGKTPFEVSREAYLLHYSQNETWFTDWIFGTSAQPINKAADIIEYSPCKFGLYRSTVGADSGIGDIFENVTPYSDVGGNKDSTETGASDSTADSLTADTEPTDSTDTSEHMTESAVSGDAASSTDNSGQTGDGKLNADATDGFSGNIIAVFAVVFAAAVGVLAVKLKKKKRS